MATLPHTSLDDILATIQAALTNPTGDITYVAGKGPVIADDTNGHTYRLGSHNGSLALTQVS
jgi:hypothetical protein